MDKKITGHVTCHINLQSTNEYVIKSFYEELFKSIKTERLRFKNSNIKILDFYNVLGNQLNFDVEIVDMDEEYEVHEIIQSAMKTLYCHCMMGFVPSTESHPPFTRYLELVTCEDKNNRFVFDYHIIWEV